MSATNSKNLRMSTPEVDSDVYVVAARALNEKYPMLGISPVTLGKYFKLLDLPVRRLVRADLLSLQDLDKALLTPAPSSADLVVVSTDITDGTIDESERGPIGTMLQMNGIPLSTESLARLMHVLMTPPKFFAKKGLISEDYFNGTGPNNVPRELQLFRQLQRDAPGPIQRHGKRAHCHEKHASRSGAHPHHHGVRASSHEAGVRPSHLHGRCRAMGSDGSMHIHIHILHEDRHSVGNSIEGRGKVHRGGHHRGHRHFD